MSDFGIPLLIIAMLAILAVDVFSVSYLKTALLDMRMRKPGFFIGSAGICVASIILSLIMAGAFLQSPVKAETTEVPKAGTVQEEVEEETKQNELEEPEEPEAKEPELTQATAVTSTTVTAPTVSANVPAAPAAQATLNTQATVPTFDVWRGYYKNFTYNFIEITNGTPYAYMPTNRGNFQSDLNNIVANREGGNIIIMANASVYNTTTTDPLGTTIQNQKIIAQNGGSNWTLVVDEAGNVGYVKGAVNGTTTDYIDAKTGATVKNRKIVSAVYAFVPFVLNGKAQEEYRGNYQNAYRARQIFCVKQNSYIIITNTGEGDTGGVWNFDDMVQVANNRGCLSAFNLDG
ncbi:phosphodiester glycosidase family protein [Candidatus Saccharibacteria bacterium]|nr:phosphodiester glycosidase family protein [Candidatus Saccharibacteria bacterium]